jgi:hypothetical protein
LNLHRALVTGMFLSLSGLACAPAGGPTGFQIHEGEIGELEESSPLALTFEAAALEHEVPADVLKAVAYVETGFEAATGEVEFEDQPAPWGLFGLRGAELERAATLIGASVDGVQADPQLGVRAAAALLSAYAEDEGLDGASRADPTNWASVVARYGELAEDMRDAYAADVMQVLAEGVAVPMEDGTNLVVRRHDVLVPVVSTPWVSDSNGLGAAGVVWRPSPNHSSRNGSRVELVVIHTCEGAYSGCASWLRNPQARASAHYVVKEDGREVSQLVDENRRAWHVAASYRSRLNSGKLTHREGRSTNDFSIGIEHGGSARQRSFPQGQIDRSITLVRDITGRHNIPRDRYHIVAHGQLQPESRTDPGPNWPWASYLRAIAQGSSNPPPSNPPPSNPPPSNPPPSNPPPSNPPPSNPSGDTIITVDNATSGRFSASNGWERSTWASGKVGSDYRFHAPQERSDLARYKVNVPSRGRYEVFARIPGNGYNTEAPYFIHHRGGRSLVKKNTSRAGASWMSLGTYEFDAKDDWVVELSVWTGGKGWIIADAIRFVGR